MENLERRLDNGKDFTEYPFQLPEGMSESALFFSVLHKDILQRNGNAVLMGISKGQPVIHASAPSIEGENSLMRTFQQEITDGILPATTNFYTTLNTFHSPKRTVENLHTLNGFYIDLDFHDTLPLFLDEKKASLVSALTYEITFGYLPQPTMIVDTGRGLALYYIFERSIPCFTYAGDDPKKLAFAKACKKAKNLYDTTYRKLIQILQQTLKDHRYEKTVDTSIMDAARLVRIPGTWNEHAHAMAHIIYLNVEAPEYTSLDFIATFAGTKRKDKEKIIEFPVERVSFTAEGLIAFAKRRTKFLIKLRDMRKKQRGTREKLCFIFYETISIYMEEEDAVKELVEFNAEFKYPLNFSEVHSIIRNGSYEKRKKRGGQYKFTNAFLKDYLSLTEEEIEHCGFRFSQRAIDRKNKKKEKNAKIRAIAKLLKEGKLSRKMIAEKMGVSLSTVQRIAKKRDLLVYKKDEDVLISINSEKIEEESHMDENVNLPSDSVYMFLKNNLYLLDKNERKENLRMYGRIYLKAVSMLYTITHLNPYDPVSSMSIVDLDLVSGIQMQGDKDAESGWFKNFCILLSDRTVRDIRFAGLSEKTVPNLSMELLKSVELIFAWQKRKDSFYYYDADTVHNAFKKMTRQDIGYLFMYLDNRIKQEPVQNLVAAVIDFVLQQTA